MQKFIKKYIPFVYRKDSIRKASISIIVPVVILLFVLLTILIWSLAQNRTLADKYIEDTARLYIDQINKNMSQMNQELIVLCGQALMQDIPDEISPSDGKYYELLSDIKQQNSILRIRYKNVWRFFSYGRKGDIYIDSEGASFKDSSRVGIKGSVIDFLKTDKNTDVFTPQWHFIQVGGRDYAIGWYEKSDKIIGCIMEVEDILSMIEEATQTYKVIPYIRLGNGRILMTSASEKQYADKVIYDETSDQVKSYQLGTLGKIHLCILNSGGITERMLNIQIVAVVMVLILIVVLGIIIYQYYLRIMEPMKRFADSLDQFNEEQMLHDDGSNSILELEIANERFKELLRKVQSLKIAIYEEELSRQKAELEYAQEKIKPHFFLNCISLIHGIADQAGEKKIIYITQTLSDYMRYIFGENSDERKISEEIRHVQLYVDIQKLRYGKDSIKFDPIIDEDLMEYRVPSLLLQILVENSVTHGMTMGKMIEISLYITSEVYDGEKNIYICVSDTGQGFRPEIMEAVKKDESIYYNGREHIGLKNIKKRLRLLYGNKADFSISNMSESGGAVIEIRIPVKDVSTENKNKA